MSAAEQAHKLGYTHVGAGVWADSTGKHVAKTVDGQLTKLTGKDPEFSGDSTKNIKVFTKTTKAEGILNSIPFKKWTPPKDWNTVDGTSKIKEPPFDNHGLRSSAGVMMMEPNGSVWIFEPTNHFSGTEHTFPKGGVEEGMSLQQTAIKEAWEETGLKAEITGFIGDVERTTSTTRYYLAKRTGGAPNQFGWETNSVKLVPINELDRYLNLPIDKKLAKKLQSAVSKSSSVAVKKDSPDSPKTNSNDAENIMFKQTGGPGGSNEGGFFLGKDGVKRYVKLYKDSTQSYSEHLTNKIYDALGLPSPKSKVFKVKDKVAYASDIIDGQTLERRGLTPKSAKKILAGFCADVLTANWDAIGLVNDNILFDKAKDEPHRIDNGGTFLFRAQAGKKPEGLLDKITEWDGFANPDINPQYSDVFQTAGYESADDMGDFAVKQITTILKFYKSIGGWEKFVDDTAPDMKEDDKNRVIQMLNARTKLLAQKVKQLS